jgi:hypothetical protein
VKLYDVTGRLLDCITGRTPAPVRIEKPSYYSGIILWNAKIGDAQRVTGKLVVY